MAPKIGRGQAADELIDVVLLILNVVRLSTDIFGLTMRRWEFRGRVKGCSIVPWHESLM